uniref:ZFP36 ring finger protein like 1 n=1 Tax=Cebus imitator TaxID=2715852 RepID=A0A2K5PC20_CEBIM
MVREIIVENTSSGNLGQVLFSGITSLSPPTSDQAPKLLPTRKSKGSLKTCCQRKEEVESLLRPG